MHDAYTFILIEFFFCCFYAKCGWNIKLRASHTLRISASSVFTLHLTLPCGIAILLFSNCMGFKPCKILNSLIFPIPWLANSRVLLSLISHCLWLAHCRLYLLSFLYCIWSQSIKSFFLLFLHCRLFAPSRILLLLFLHSMLIAFSVYSFLLFCSE